MFTFEIKELEEVPSAAKWLLETIGNSRVVTVDGEMGMGKTTLISEVCRQLKVEDEPSSPTYSIINEYMSPIHGPVYHMDCYRLKTETEALDFGIEEYLDGGNYCFIEWSERIHNLLPDLYVRVSIISKDKIRIITVDK